MNKEQHKKSSECGKLIEAAVRLIANNGGRTSTVEGANTHVLVRDVDYEHLRALVSKKIAK